MGRGPRMASVGPQFGTRPWGWAIPTAAVGAEGPRARKSHWVSPEGQRLRRVTLGAHGLQPSRPGLRDVHGASGPGAQWGGPRTRREREGVGRPVEVESGHLGQGAGHVELFATRDLETGGRGGAGRGQEGVIRRHGPWEGTGGVGAGCPPGSHQGPRRSRPPPACPRAGCGGLVRVTWT